MNAQAGLVAVGVGTALQLAMVVFGHAFPPARGLFAIGGMVLSLLTGLGYAVLMQSAWSGTLVGGAIAGGIAAFVGIAVSCWLGDVPLSLLAFGTIASAIAGLAGGALAKAFV